MVDLDDTHATGARHEHWDERPTYDDEAYPEENEGPMLYGEGATNPRRGQATILMVVGAVVFLFSLVILAAFLIGEGFQDTFDFLSFATWIWIFFGVLILILIWLIILLLTTPPREAEDWYEEEEEVASEYPIAQYAQPGDTDTISLRCPRCMTIFSLQDPHERPFYHDCPQCQVRGVYAGP